MAINDTNVISDPFWLNIGAETVYNSQQARKDAVARLQATIVWVLGIYTSTSIAGLIIKKKEDIALLALIFFAFAYALLIIAYYTATVSSFPVPESFYGADPASVRDAFNRSAKLANRRFKWAMFFTSAGVLLYSLALLSQFGNAALLKLSVDKYKPQELSISVSKPDGNKTIIFSIKSQRSSWNQFLLMHDTTVNKKTITDTIKIEKNGLWKDSWLFVDSTGTQTVRIANPGKMGMYVILTRKDLLNGGKLEQTNRVKTPVN